MDFWKGFSIMAKNLVIVESPAKAKTIQKFLGSNYKVIASNGHVRDLPKSQMGIDVDNDFKPDYLPMPGKKKVIQEELIATGYLNENENLSDKELNYLMDFLRTNTKFLKDK